MTVYLLAGGGTAGHVNPLLATADELRRAEPDATIIVLGTAEGLESRLVPAAGYELATIAKLPFPRGLSVAALTYPFRLARAVRTVRSLIRNRSVDVVVGFGGYASAPAYLAARLEKAPIVIHEANAIPGIANKLGAAFSRFVGVTFAGTPIAHATTVGMPLRPEIATLDRVRVRPDARKFFGLDQRPVLLVTGGSTGAARINGTILDSIADITAAGWQVVHTVGETRDFVDPKIDGYHPLRYCDRMDFALATADVVVARAGSATVSELSGLGIPTVFVPYPVGNGEQAKNAADVVGAGGAVLCRDADFTPEYVRSTLIPLLKNNDAQRQMSQAAQSVGIRDGSSRLAALIHTALATSTA
ncbi:MAG: UDP-N-acetylglucosamine--N-acetylmuramyl-(pentapeptide) pyrophosphoryl-undecaprenol N-acetylglucosamine transferase [Microbacteriaceae bacterium]